MIIRPASQVGFATIEFDDKDERAKEIIKKKLFGLNITVKPASETRKKGARARFSATKMRAG